jgi:hypothetical protein
MSCRKIRRSLSRYYRGELTPQEEELIARHIRECKGCSKEAQSFLALKDAIQGLDRFTPSPAFESKLEQKIKELPSTEKEPKVKSLFTVFPSLRWAFIPMAAVALALFLVLKGGFHKSQTISEKPETVTSAETSLVRTPVESTQELPSQMVESSAEKESDKTIRASFVKNRKPSRGAVFVMDNLRLSDLEELPDSRMPEHGSANFVIDAVNYRPVDNRQTNVGYILPAVSTASSKVRKVY